MIILANTMHYSYKHKDCMINELRKVLKKLLVFKEMEKPTVLFSNMF